MDPPHPPPHPPPSSSPLPSTAVGTKRQRAAPSLLPAFEPCPSSPSLPPLKRARISSTNSFVGLQRNETTRYPTPVPTSSTGIVSSSSPPKFSARRRRPGLKLKRTMSTLSERAPLSCVPSIELDIGGEPALLGRSGKSSDYQLSANKFISRVHVRAAYVSGDSVQGPRVEVLCLGYNGIKVHYMGAVYDVERNECFLSDAEGADIMIDVQDARILLQWPRAVKRATTPTDTDSGSEYEVFPGAAAGAMLHRTPSPSPLGRRARLRSPVSPTPAVDTVGALSSPPLVVQVYEDTASDDDDDDQDQQPVEATQPTQHLSQPSGTSPEVRRSFEHEAFSDQDEENEPTAHSFGSSSDANVAPRMPSFSAKSPNIRRRLGTLEEKPTSPAEVSGSVSSSDALQNPVVNHVVNQLAFSRLSSTPLSTIMHNLPDRFKEEVAGLRGNRKVTLGFLKKLIEGTSCIGEVARTGNDADGMPLESEYYYIPEEDADEDRRDAVVEGLRKPGLRACRKQHKQYFWVMPR